MSMQQKSQIRIVFAAAAVALTGFASFEATRLTGMTTSDPDAAMLGWLRDPSRPDQMIGPPVLQEAMRDYTALGGYAVLLIAILVAALFLYFLRGRSDVRFLLLTSLGGYTAGMSLKVLFGRPRPSVVTHLSHVSSLSFPSVHSMMSAVVFITIGLLLSEMTTDRRVRVLLLAAPLCLTLLVGFSRVCMGVHYPTDVLAGWGVGLGWTWTAFQLRHRWQNAKV
ncbi:MAG: phosphatase PAP2 family protein [Planctomycetaceae bacterium]|nr:phosphatase PAP2 family protein [Planctomycetaceae bacterium]